MREKQNRAEANRSLTAMCASFNRICMAEVQQQQQKQHSKNVFNKFLYNFSGFDGASV